MRHPEDRLSAYVDGALSHLEATRVAAHLAQCPACRETVADLRAVRSLLRRAREPEPSPELGAWLLRVPDSPRTRRPMTPWVVAAVAAGLAGLLLAARPWPPSPSQTFEADLRDHARVSSGHPMGEMSLTYFLSSLLGEPGFEEE